MRLKDHNSIKVKFIRNYIKGRNYVNGTAYAVLNLTRGTKERALGSSLIMYTDLRTWIGNFHEANSQKNIAFRYVKFVYIYMCGKFDKYFF